MRSTCEFVFIFVGLYLDECDKQTNKHVWNLAVVLGVLVSVVGGGGGVVGRLVVGRLVVSVLVYWAFTMLGYYWSVRRLEASPTLPCGIFILNNQRYTGHSHHFVVLSCCLVLSCQSIRR